MRNTVNTPNAAASSLKGQRGFTLVEMAIVTMIIGLIIAATAQLMTQRQHWLQKQRTETAVATANNAISGFRDTYGRYPCPASLSAVAGDPFYGIESDCSDVATVAEGTGVDAALGYARVVSDPTTLGDPARVVTYFDKNLGADVGPVAPRIRIGTLPFKNLNLEETSILDGYGNRIIYAVTEQMAVSDTYEDDDGGIIILNDQGDSIVAPDHSAHFLILSSGENGNGAYTYGGGRLPCTAGSLESDNCNFDADAIFRFAQTSTRAAGNANTYDDVITYATQQSTPLWEKNPDGVQFSSTGYNDVAMKPSGNFGIGPTASKTPGEEVQVDGIIVVRDDLSTTEEGEDEGKLESNVICDYASGSTTCFASSLIAGEIDTGGGMQCPDGEYMTGIKNGAPVCESEIFIKCPFGKFVIGVKADGSLNCGSPPPPGCITTDVTLCTETKTLFAASHGTYKTVTVSTAPGNPGGTRSATYRCEYGTWKHKWTSGNPCNCTPDAQAPYDISCATSSDCGNRFFGTKTVQSQYPCPAGFWNTVTLDDTACVPYASKKTRDIACPAGFNAGRIYQENIHDPTTLTCSGWKETDRTCKCSPDVDHRNIPCSSGLDGTIPQVKLFTCPDGADNPGLWGGWTNEDGKPDSDFCSCTPTSYTDKRACPTPGHVGDYWVKVNFTCPDAKWEDVMPPEKDTCAPPEPRICYWTPQGFNSGTSGPKLSRHAGDSCDCGLETDPPKVCSSAKLATNVYAYDACLCQ